MRSAVAFTVLAVLAGSSAALAQAPPAAAPAAPASAAPAPAAAKAAPVPAAAAPAKTASAAQKCMRLPLSDIAVGRAETIAQAQLRLKEYSEDEAKKRGWKGPLVKSAETVSCEDYLYLPVIGQEYKCLVTATFCVGPATAPASKPVAAAAKPAPKPAPKAAN